MKTHSPRRVFFCLTAALFLSVAAAKDVVTAYSMLTHDGRRLISRQSGKNTVWELVPTNSLPPGLPPVRNWTIYGIKSAHSDLGLHRSNYIQRKGTVARMEKAAKLFDADAKSDDDPAAFRWVMEGWWSFLNYPADRGDAAARDYLARYLKRGRTDVGGNWCGSSTHLMGYEELCRSLYMKREMEEKWGVRTATAQLVDNPGISSALIGLYRQAGIKYLTHWPNSYTMGLEGRTLYVDPVSDDRPAVFWWEAPDGERILVWTNHGGYINGHEFGIDTGFIDKPSHPFPEEAVVPSPNWRVNMARWEQTTAKRLKHYEKSLPYDIWLFPNYHDDEIPSTRLSDAFAEWNSKWAVPVFRSVGSLDEPFLEFEKRWGGSVPVVKGDLSCAWDRATPAYAEILARKFAADRLLPRAEARTAIASASGQPYPRDDFRHSYEALQLADDHSYGFSGYSGRRCYDTWAQRLDWIETAESTARRYAGSEPPCRLERGKVCRDGTTENKWYRVSVTNGVIYSIYDKELRRELVSGKVNKFLYTRDRYKTWARDSDLGAAKLTSSISLPGDRKAILIENIIENAGDLLNDDRFKRYGHYAFEFAVESPGFVSQINGPVIDQFKDTAPHVANSFSCIRDWCAVENGRYGIALVQPDTCVMEYGRLHGARAFLKEKTPRSSSMYSLAFGDGLQWHLASPPSFRFRYIITSYRGDWRSAGIPSFAARETGALAADEKVAERISFSAPGVELVAFKGAEDGNGYIARFRETHGKRIEGRIIQNVLSSPVYTLTDILERDVAALPAGKVSLAPFSFVTVRISRPGFRLAFAPLSFAWTGLIVRPRAFAGGIKGQIYLLWGAVEGAVEYELYRDGRHIATVKPETEDGIELVNVRYDDRGLESGREYSYSFVPVFRNGIQGRMTPEFTGKTR